jgi:hypothetical protein
MTMSQLMTKVSLGVAVAGTLVMTLPSASQAAFGENRYYYQNDDSDGTAWDYYRGYFSNENTPSTDATQPRASTRAQRGQRRNAAEPAPAPAARPTCMVGADGGCR